MLAALVMATTSLAGCTGVLDTTVDPRASLNAYPLQIQEGETVTFDARDSDAVEGVITTYQWDFGDGQASETVSGFTSHTYASFGVFNAQLTITNDQGGTDDITTIVFVNGAPQLNLTFPESIRSGDSALLDASDSYDPEGKDLMFEWDLDWSEDSDKDGDPRNDVDATTDTVLVPTNTSGTITGSIFLDDGNGATVQEVFKLEIMTRRYEVTWETVEVEYSWDEYLDQGEEWQGNITPGVQGRILDYEGILTLAQDVIAPQDNFSLNLYIVDDNYKRSEQTAGENITSNESATATVADDGLNGFGEDGIFDSDSAEDLMEFLLSNPSARSGQGDWVWTVVAQQADPDPLFAGAPDPDPGNDWTLTVVVKIHVPQLVEIAYE
ncbi:MAG: PKD domain-containing protein [Candidatus Poseidoniaceae archaeon]|nr:PKD domain-containing protein [Candidatus Poseidoniaceae archaeon]